MLLLFLLPLITAEPLPPPHEDLVGNARWLVKYANFSVVATHSSFLEGYPFAQSKDVADGLYEEPYGTGIPYIYSSTLATLRKDFVKNPKVTFSYSSEFTHYCQDNKIDTDSPTCSKVMLSGEMSEVTDKDEIAWAQKGMFSRHPVTKFWPSDFSFWKLNIENIFVLDYYGGPTLHLNRTEYFNYQPSWSTVDI